MSTSTQTTSVPLPPTSLLRHIVDVHCHPTDAPDGVSDASMQRLGITICAMATMQQDQDKVKDLALRFPGKVVPCFGYHPWFSHFISTSPPSTPQPTKETHYRALLLPTPTPTSPTLEADFQALLPHLPSPLPLSTLLSTLHSNLSQFPNAMLGEVGVDRAFRVPLPPSSSHSSSTTATTTTTRVLTPFHIPLEHQMQVFEAQVEVAVELGRNISVHSVQAQQATIELMGAMKRRYGEMWMRVSVDLHSCGFSAESWRDVERNHENAFLSLSTVINASHPNHRALIAACAPNRLLSESDYNNIDMCTPQTWDMINIIANVRGWRIESEDWVDDEGTGKDDKDPEPEENWGVIRRLERNWIRFRDGGHKPRLTKKQKKKVYSRSELEEESDGEGGTGVDIKCS